MTCAPAADPATCLTPSEVEIVKAIYKGAVRSDTAAQIYPGFEPGAESELINWPLWITGWPRAGSDCIGSPAACWGFQTWFGWGFFGYFMHGSLAYDIRTFNFASDMDAVDAAFAAILNAVDPDLRAFRKRGGKLIQYHGFDDAAVAPKNSIKYWSEVEAKLKAEIPGYTRADQNGFFRLFMAPGLAHCWGGPGATAFGNAENGSVLDAEHDLMLALEHWVEDGVAPERIIALHPSTGPNDPAFERPLCPYPKLPRYRSGDPSLAASWDCKAPLLRLKKLRQKILPKSSDSPRDPSPAARDPGSG